MGKNNYISYKELAKLIHVHKKTLTYWMCHYSLAQYSGTIATIYENEENIFRITKESIKHLEEYLCKKHGKYRYYFEKNKKQLENMIE